MVSKELHWLQKYFQIQNKIAGELITFKSIDSVIKQDGGVRHPTEFLNSLELPGFPPHNLQLKIGSAIITLRNINQPRLCNGTRLTAKKLMSNVIEATILNGKYTGEDVLILRIPLIPNDMPLNHKRLQFPVWLAFAISINKFQGQSLSVFLASNLKIHVFHMASYMSSVPVPEYQQKHVYMRQKKKLRMFYIIKH
jgi:PIF1 helicase.